MGRDSQKKPKPTRISVTVVPVNQQPIRVPVDVTECPQPAQIVSVPTTYMSDMPAFTVTPLQGPASELPPGTWNPNELYLCSNCGQEAEVVRNRHSASGGRGNIACPLCGETMAQTKWPLAVKSET